MIKFKSKERDFFERSEVMKMEKLLRCRDLGLDCNFEACGDTAEEALRIAADHAQAVHGVKSIPVRGPKRAWDAIQDAFCVPKGGFPPDEGIF